MVLPGESLESVECVGCGNSWAPLAFKSAGSLPLVWPAVQRAAILSRVEWQRLWK
jgi:hypothetical protein